LLLWYKRATIERGHDKLIDLQVGLVPHTDKPKEAFRHLNEFLLKMTEEQ
jgi:hypothetical protein